MGAMNNSKLRVDVEVTTSLSRDKLKLYIYLLAKSFGNLPVLDDMMNLYFQTTGICHI